MEKIKLLNKIKNLNKIPKDAKIAVIMGGMSAEREISLRSGKNCLDYLLKQGYKNAFSVDMDKNLAKVLTKNNTELAFIILHGTYGEDGYVQKILKDLNIPYTGSGVESSKVCINKRKTKEVLEKHNIPCPKTIKDISEQINFPVFCKPTDQGSSLGAGLVNNKTELEEKIKEIKKYSSETALIEEFIEGIELTVGVLQVEDEVFATDILEIRVKNGEYDYNNKYTPGALDFYCPARIDQKTTDKIKDLVVKSFKAVNCKGFARIDVILKDNKPYIIEINTIPGMTDTSDLPYQSKTFGITNEELVNIILHSTLIEKGD